MIRRLKGLRNVKIAQERATLANCFGDGDTWRVVLPLSLEVMSCSMSLRVLTRDPLVGPVSLLLQINALPSSVA